MITEEQLDTLEAKIKAEREALIDQIAKTVDRQEAESALKHANAVLTAAHAAETEALTTLSRLNDDLITYVDTLRDGKTPTSR